MRFSELLRLVFTNIFENKTKLFLTSLGIIVGSATIVLVIAIGQGGKQDVADQFKNLNAGAIEISVSNKSIDMMGNNPDMADIKKKMMQGGGGSPDNMKKMMESSGMPGMSATSVTLSQEDVDSIQSMIPGLTEVSILTTDKADVLGGSMDSTESMDVVGILDNYDKVSNLSVEIGEFISEDDNINSNKVCVIGYSVAEEMFTYSSLAYGEYVEIGGVNYEVIGVLNSMGSVSSGISPDSAVYVPYNTATKYIFGKSVTPTIAAVAEDVNNVPSIMDNINILLTENHTNANFEITDAGSAMEVANSSANTLSMLLLAVATIVFIVGGIGIMNVMFVSVKERTSEIGLLKAIGCSKSTILSEFLLEAGILSFIGGVVGVAVSFALFPLVEMMGIRTEPTTWSYLVALLFAVLTGTVFGFYPAYKASRLVPIEALNLN